MQTVSVRFPSDGPDVLGLIEIDAPLASGGPEASWRALSSLRLQIVSAQFRVTGDRLLQRLHVCELDGEPIEPARARELRNGLHVALGQGLSGSLKGPRRAVARRAEDGGGGAGGPSSGISAV